MMSSDSALPFTSYQKRLFIFLSVATFFEGYDFIALTQILPELRADMDLSRDAAAYLVAFINAGTMAAYLLIRLADRIGRKPVLTITIVGYTTFTFFTGFAPDIYSFAAFQFVARTFLIAEWAISMVYAAEAFPAARRGMVIGTISAFSSFGAIACAGVVPALTSTAYGWRTVYLVGIVPLVILAFARRNLHETERFRDQRDQIIAAGKRSLFALFRSIHRRRLLQMALIWATVYLCTHNVVTFWKDFAINERGLTDKQVAQAISVAALVSMPLIFAVGPLIDRVGRKAGAAVILVLASAGAFSSYTMTGLWPLTVAMIFSIFGAAAVLPVLNAFTTELFPTEVRGDAFAWANNLLGRTTYVISPLFIGYFTEAYDVGYGPVIRWAAVAPIVALALIWLLLPETKARELEETAMVAGDDKRSQVDANIQ